MLWGLGRNSHSSRRPSQSSVLVAGVAEHADLQRVVEARIRGIGMRRRWFKLHHGLLRGRQKLSFAALLALTPKAQQDVRRRTRVLARYRDDATTACFVLPLSRCGDN